jgi:hypothetical protein
MTPTQNLLHRCSWHAEKLLRKRGNFNSVLWIAERADGRRESFETWASGTAHSAWAATGDTTWR